MVTITKNYYTTCTTKLCIYSMNICWVPTGFKALCWKIQECPELASTLILFYFLHSLTNYYICVSNYTEVKGNQCFKDEQVQHELRTQQHLTYLERTTQAIAVSWSTKKQKN